MAQLGWAAVIGAAAAVVSFGIRWLALSTRPHMERRLLLLTPLAGLAVAGLAIAFAEGTGKPSSEVLFSGQTALPPLLEHSADYTAGALVLLLVCKALACSISLSSFRGGPTFPGMFVGAAGGIALSHLPGLPMIAGAAIGIGAMTAGMLQLPITAVLLTTLFLGTDGIKVMPPDDRGGRGVVRPDEVAGRAARPGEGPRTSRGGRHPATPLAVRAPRVARRSVRRPRYRC